jgi:hypothetical protein
VALGCALGACAVLVGATLWQSHSQRRPHIVQSFVSGRAGLRRTTAGALERWPSSPLTITIDPSLARATPEAKAAVIEAFGAWMSSDAHLPQVTFNATDTPGEASQDGVNRLVLGPITAAGFESDLALTIAYFDIDTGAVVETDTIFNSAYNWVSLGTAPIDGGDGGASVDTSNSGNACDGRYDFQNVATHEAGHFFGLGEDYDDTSTTMYFSSGPCQTNKRTLSTTDVTVMSGLYAQPLVSSPQNAACHARIAGGRGQDGTALVAVGMVAFAVKRRRARRPRI